MIDRPFPAAATIQVGRYQVWRQPSGRWRAGYWCWCRRVRHLHVMFEADRYQAVRAQVHTFEQVKGAEHEA